jgi:F-type H+-transporting ATPase subunit b
MIDSLIFLAATEAVPAESGNVVTEIATRFGVEWPLLIAQVVNFALVAFVLWRFAFKPVLATMDERNRKIQEGLQFAEASKQQLEETEKRQAAVLKEANEKAQAILAEARDQSTAYAEQQRAVTDRQMADLLARGQESIERERQKMLSDVRQEVARLVVLTTGKVLETELSDADKSRFNSAAAERISAVN